MVIFPSTYMIDLSLNISFLPGLISLLQWQRQIYLNIYKAQYCLLFGDATGFRNKSNRALIRRLCELVFVCLSSC